MTRINVDWTLEQLDDSIKATASHYVPPPSRVISVEGCRMVESEERIVKHAHVAEQILHRVPLNWRSLEVDTMLKKWVPHHEASLRARENLRHQEEICQNLGGDALELSAAKLHPWIWQGASSLWQYGYFRDAVEGAFRKLNVETQNKLGRRDVSETNLLSQAFSEQPRAAKKPRLHHMSDAGNKIFKSIKRDARMFAEGVFTGFCNPVAEEGEQEMLEQQAPEYLAALSVQARWVGESTLEVTS